MTTISKTKSGKFRFTLSAEDRQDLYWRLAGYIESESLKIRFQGLKDGDDVFVHMFYAVINTLVMRQHSKFFMTNEKFLLTRPEALALIWFLRSSSKQSFIELKSHLHKSLLS